MLGIVIKTQFRRDTKKAIRRGKNLTELEVVISLLVGREPLEHRHNDHKLTGNYGNYEGCRECHIEPDWLLIYQINEVENELLLVRNGTHSDLFGK